MSELNDFYIKDKKTTLHPMTGEWKVVDLSGKGDYTSINDAYDAGDWNIFLREGNHVLTRDILRDMNNRPDDVLRIHGVSRSTTKVIINDGATFHNMKIYYDKDYQNYYDYSVNPPTIIQSGYKTISCSLGGDRVYADNFNWNTLASDGLTSLTPYRIEVGDYIELGEGIVYFRIQSIDESGTFLTIEDHNDVIDFVEEIGWRVSKNCRIEFKNFAMTVDGQEIINQNVEFFSHRSSSITLNQWNYYVSMSYNLDTFDFYGGDFNEFATTGRGAGSQAINCNFMSLNGVYIAKLYAIGCYFDIGYMYSNNVFVDCVFDKGDIIVSKNCKLINCTNLNGRIVNNQNYDARIMGCEDFYGPVDDVMPLDGYITESLYFQGRDISPSSYVYAYQDIGSFISSGIGVAPLYESDVDVITSIQVYDGGEGLTLLSEDMNYIDLSKIKKYYGILIQDGTTDHTILSADETLITTPIVDTDNMTVRFKIDSSSSVDNLFVIDNVSLNSNEIRIRDSWSILSPYINGDGYLVGAALHFNYAHYTTSGDYTTKFYRIQIQAKDISHRINVT